MRKHVIPALVVLLCAVMAFALPVTAAVPGANEGNSSLTLHFYDRGQRRALSDAYFYLYKVGDYVSGPVNGIYDFTATKDFEDAKVDLNGLDFRTGVDNLTGIINALIPYTELNKDTVKTVGEGSTDSDGNLTLTDLTPGLYLVWGEALEVKEYDENGESMEWTYIPYAFLIPLPYPMPGGSFDHEMTAEVKYERFPPPTAQDIDITVEKKWEPEDKSHPDSVIAVLLRNGEVNDRIVLDAGNNWTHTWERLEINPKLRWEVTEIDVPEGYTVSVDRDGYYFTITNKIVDLDDLETPPPPSEEEPPPPTPSEEPSPDDPTPTPPEDPSPDDPAPTPPEDPSPDDPTPTPPDDPAPTPPGDSTDLNAPPVFSDMPIDSDTRSLPQTGQLWWPMLLLAAIGVPLLLIGAVLFVWKEESEEFE